MRYSNFLPLLSFTFFFTLARGASSPILPLYYKAAELSKIDIGIILAAYGIGFLIAEAAWGFAFERMGTRKSVLVLTLISPVNLILFSQPQPFVNVLGLQVLLGVTMAGIGVFTRIEVTNVASAAERARAFGLLGGVFALGTTVGTLIGGASAILFGLPDAFIIAGVLALLALGPLTLGRRRRGAPEQPETTPPGNPEPTSQPIRRLPRVELIVLGTIAIAAAVSYSFYGLLLPNILTQDPSFSATVVDVSIVLSLFNLSQGVLQPLMGAIGSRSPRRWVIGALLVNGVMFLALTQTRMVSAVEAITIVAGLTVATMQPLSLTILISGISKTRISRVLGLYGAAEDFGILVGSSAGSFLWALWGVDSAYALDAAVVLGVALAYLAVIQSQKARNRPLVTA